MLSDGQAKVKIEVVDDSSKEKNEEKVIATPVVDEAPELTPKKGVEKPKPQAPAKPKTQPKSYENTKPKPKPEPKPEPKKATKSRYRSVTAGNYSDFDLYKIELKRPEKSGYGVQIASFKEYNNALRHIAELEGKSFDNVLLSIEKGDFGDPLYKVILGPFDSRDSANNYKKSAKKRYKMNGFVVDLSKLRYD